jgi:hypothetical protein
MTSSPVLGAPAAVPALARLGAIGSGAPADLLADVPALGLDAQRVLANGAGFRISIDTPGWYRLTQPALLAAGLGRGVDPRTFRLLVNGRELAIRVTGQTAMAASIPPIASSSTARVSIRHGRIVRSTGWFGAKVPDGGFR